VREIKTDNEGNERFYVGAVGGFVGQFIIVVKSVFKVKK
jgi:hypothetical protein